MKTILTLQQRAKLVKKYAEPHRHYHTLEHIATLFQLASAHGIKLSIPQQLAIWYHDAIYNINSTNNEQLSAEFFLSESSSNCWLSKTISDRTVNIILATKTHFSDIHEVQTVLDLDLAGLGFDWETYIGVAKDQVRLEYTYLNDNIWNINRKLFLRNMLKRNYIYYTPWARDSYERQARLNIERELKELDV